MKEKNTCNTTLNTRCLEALYRRQLTLGQALEFASDLEVLRLFDCLREIEKFIHLAEQTETGPEKNFEGVCRRIKHLKSVAAEEFFERTQI